MKQMLLASACALAFTTCANAQQATAIGTGVGVAKSNSKSEAVAISGQGGAGGTGVNAGAISPTAIINSSVPANQSIKTVPTVFAPGLTAAGIESCLGSVSGGGSWLGTGISLGGTVPDTSCSARLDARTLWSMGLRKAAVARLCINPDMYNSMPEVCAVYLPRAVPVAYGPQPTFSYNADRSIMLVDGRTGVEHLCTNYDEPRQRCRVWADAVVRVHYAANRKRLRHIDPVVPTVTTAASQEDKSK